jgi:hypothetical protein
MKHVFLSFSPRYSLMSIIVSIILVSLSVSACAQPSPASSPTTQATTTSTPNATGTTSPAATTPSGYSIPVFLNDKQTATLTITDLSKLPQVSVTVEGTAEQGPTLTSALASIGIKDFTSVTIDGFSKGRLATAQLVLQKSQVTDDVILALVARGSVKLTGTSIGAAKAVIDVNKVTVK